MSILSRSNPNMATRTPSFHEFKKQASFFLKEKIKTARLALTDVTPAELLAEEAVSGNLSASPDSPTLHRISRAAFEVGDYWRIVEVLHKRFDKRNWRISYNALIVLEHLLTHGPESVADEFQGDKDVIAQCGAFQYIDEKGFNWGLAVRKKADKILKLLEKGPLLQDERDRSRKLKRGIQGFGSFCGRAPVTKDGPGVSSHPAYGRCSSQCGPENKEDQVPFCGYDVGLTEQERSHSGDEVNSTKSEDFFSAGVISKENVVPRKEADREELHKWRFTLEAKPLLVGKLDDCRNGFDLDDDHPFNDHQISHSLLAGAS